MIRRFLGALGVLALLSIAAWGFFTIRSFNHFDDIASRFEGRCEAVTGIAGPEDLQIDYATRKLFISSFDRRAAVQDKKSSLRGSIHLFDLQNPLNETSWRDRTNGIPEDFEPQGLHLYDDGQFRRLFVVNAAQHTVELFDVMADGDLVHLETFNERRLTSPNDVFAVGPRSFYVTNDQNSNRASLRGQLAFLFRLRSGVVFYFNGTSWHQAAENIQYANGLAMSTSGTKFYIAETAGGNILEYDRNLNTGYLTLARTIDTDAAVDNINIDEEGAFWIGAHPRPLTLALHLRDESNLAPSKVFSFEPETGTLKTVYEDDGSLLSGSSSAAKLNRKLVIGALYDKKFLICDMDR